VENKIAVFVATWCYSGLIPPVILTGMAGTYGSFFSIPLCCLALLLARQGWWPLYCVILILVLLLGFWSVPKAEAALGPKTDWRGKIKIHDQNQIVIDETFGMLVTCCPLAMVGFNSYLLVLGSAFALFRFFDIVKIPPATFFDKMKNAWGVMFDDFVAGIYAAIVLLLLVLTLGL